MLFRSLGYLTNDFEISPDFQLQSGLPYSVGISGAPSKGLVYLNQGAAPTATLISTSSFNGSAGANRIPGIDRNVFQQPKTYVVDLRLSKKVVVRERYGLEFLAEAFNLMNHPNVTAVGTTAYTFPSTADAAHPFTNELVPYTSTTFHSVTGINNSNFAYNVRQLQLAVRFTF